MNRARPFITPAVRQRDTKIAARDTPITSSPLAGFDVASLINVPVLSFLRTLTTTPFDGLPRPSSPPARPPAA
ncbi:hypothetical protein EVG20_g3601 [Dentipellis fragilis]|uniref:Uncharacterized protein n=1 Tax=Dentipellis fragilis TaxID=205917 RepID=A0A4Y9Z352_9AGAM|nr:hypothetical protein EVG20_g3601 [Dentipellis fragilis]